MTATASGARRGLMGMAAIVVVLTMLGLSAVAATAKTRAPEDPRAVRHDGNATTCADVGFANDTFLGADADGSASADGITVTTTQGTYVQVSIANGSNVVIDAIVVKGGDAYNVYGPEDANSDGSFSDLRAPTNDGGNIPAISHWFLCYHEGDVPPPPETHADPAATIDECTAKGDTAGITVTLTNPGDAAALGVEIQQDGTTQHVDIPAHTAVTPMTVSLPQTEDVATSVTVTYGETLLATQDFDSNCSAPVADPAIPAATLAQCTGASAGPGITVNLTNTGGSVAPVVIDQDGTQQSVDVPAGTLAANPVVVALTQTEDTPTTVTVTTGVTQLAKQTFTSDCKAAEVQAITTTTTTTADDPAAPDQVLGTEATRELPRTGAETGQLALLGLLLVSGGALLLWGSRRRTADLS